MIPIILLVTELSGQLLITNQKDTNYQGASNNKSRSNRNPTDSAKMNTSNINLNELYYDFKVLTKIVGKTNFDKLMVLFQELKDNTAAVPCALAGGANG